MQRRFFAFTLVELLVVIAIIATLLAILLPSLRKAKSQAVSVVCASHLKEMAAVTHLYASDNGGYGPYQTWPPIVASYMNLQGPPFPLACPAKAFGTDPPGYDTGRPWSSNISLNRWLDDDGLNGGSPSNGITSGSPHPSGVYYWSLPLWKVQDPVNITMYYDAMLISEFYPTLPAKRYSSEFGYGWSSLDYRHPGNVGNIAFVDQHVEAVTNATPWMWTH